MSTTIIFINKFINNYMVEKNYDIVDDEEETYNYLIYQGFEKDDILFLKEVYKKEGIKFCIKTFNSFSLLELKDNLNEKKAKDNKNIFKKIGKYFKC
jgi:hypothetical protein